VGGSAATIVDRRVRVACEGASEAADIAQLQRQADKARRRAQERIRLGSQEMLGMTPKLWLEALDKDHRYGSILYHYWQRWEASRTRWMFFDWLDHGRGALIDLPACPRRLLDEAKTLYLTREQLKLCEVRIDEGRLRWCADDEPVTLPVTEHMPSTARARAVTALIDEQLAPTRRREQLLCDAREAVHDALREGAPPTPEALSEATRPLVREGLLRSLRDRHFHQRAVVLPTIQDPASYHEMWERFKVRSRWTAGGELVGPKDAGPAYALPSELLPDLSWADVLAAINHEVREGGLWHKTFSLKIP
jgi:hypothetical protein